FSSALAGHLNTAERADSQTVTGDFGLALRAKGHAKGPRIAKEILERGLFLTRQPGPYAPEFIQTPVLERCPVTLQSCVRKLTNLVSAGGSIQAPQLFAGVVGEPPGRIAGQKIVYDSCVAAGTDALPFDSLSQFQCFAGVR